jgi:phage protein D
MTSQTTDEELALGTASMRPEVLVGAAAAPLADAGQQRLVRVVVDLHVGMPDVFELTFLDAGHDVLSACGLALGTKVSVKAGVRDSEAVEPLVEGEITVIEGSYGEGVPYTLVRGHSLEHRLQRVRRTRTFANVTDSDVARRVASDAGLTLGTIESTTQRHAVLGQDNQTDWQLLRERAEELGFEVGLDEGRFFFRKARSASGTAVAATLHANLLSFEPRVSSVGMVTEVEVRAWDPVNAKAQASRQPVAAPGVSIGAGDPAAAARPFAGAAPAPATGAGTLGPAPSAQAHVVFDRAVDIDGSSTAALDAAASALAAGIGSGFAEAEGQLLGDARLVAGAVLRVEGVPDTFAGSWTVTRARHVFDHRHGSGYRTHVTVSGRQDRSLAALAGGGTAGNNRGPTRIAGVVGGVVTAIDDPEGLARVKVALPWLSPEYESGWAPVAQLTAGKATGTLFLPEVNDEVLVAFEFGDLRRPYVVGSVVNKRTGSGGALEPGGSTPGSSAVKAGRPASVVRRGLVTPSGNRLVFHDDGPPSGGRPTASEVVLGTSGDKIALVLDQVAGTLSLKCTPGGPPGKLTIECDGTVEIKAGASGSLTVDGGSQLTLKGSVVQVEAQTALTLKGKPIQLN